jgi:hypothetical protein
MCNAIHQLESGKKENELIKDTQIKLVEAFVLSYQNNFRKPFHTLLLADPTKKQSIKAIMS